MICLLWLCLLPLTSHASYRDCLTSYRAGHYIKAAQCLRTLVVELDRQKSPSKEQLLAKGSAIRSAAIALSKAAKRQKDIEKAGYLRTQAIELLQRYERENLAPNIARQKSTRRIRLQLQEALKLTPLSVIGGTPTATLQIKGYQFQATAKGKWLQSVRPGRYTIVATYEDGSRKRQTLTVAPGKAAFATFQPPANRVTPPRRTSHKRRQPIPPPRPKASPLRLTGWVLLGVGVAAMAGSIAPFALLQGANAELSSMGEQYKASCANQATSPLSNACKDMSQQVRATHSSAKTYQVAGFAVLGAGAAVAVIGAILVATSGTKSASATALAKPAKEYRRSRVATILSIH